MNIFLKKYTEQRIEQICESSQLVSNKEVTSAENIKNVDVDKKFFKILKPLFELKMQRNVLSEKRKQICVIKNGMNKLFKRVTRHKTPRSRDTKFDNIIVLAISCYYMGVIYAEDLKGKKQNLFTAEVYFEKCLKLLKGKELERKAIMTVIRVHIDLHVVLYRLGQSDKAYSLLDTAMELYSKYTKEEIEYPDPVDFTVILGLNFEEIQNSKVLLERLHLLVLENLSKLYFEYCENKNNAFVIFIHDILSKTIEETMSSNENIILWAATSLELSYYFLQNYLFTEARNHIAAAQYMTEIFQRNMLMTKDQEDFTIQTQAYKLYKIVCGYIARYWGVYGVQLLINSNERLIQKEDNESHEADNSESVSVMESEGKLLIFTDLEMDLKNFTAQFPDKRISNLNDAKKIVVNVSKQFSTADQYFPDNMSFFLEKTLLTAMTYQHLANFHLNRNEQKKLIKSQIDVLEKALLHIRMRNSTLESLAEPNMSRICKQLRKAHKDLFHAKESKESKSI